MIPLLHTSAHIALIVTHERHIIKRYINLPSLLYFTFYDDRLTVSGSQWSTVVSRKFVQILSAFVIPCWV